MDLGINILVEETLECVLYSAAFGFVAIYSVKSNFRYASNTLEILWKFFRKKTHQFSLLMNYIHFDQHIFVTR